MAAGSRRSAPMTATPGPVVSVGVGDHHRVVVGVHDPRGLLADLVHVAARRQAGAQSGDARIYP